MRVIFHGCIPSVFERPISYQATETPNRHRHVKHNCGPEADAVMRGAKNLQLFVRKDSYQAAHAVRVQELPTGMFLGRVTF